MTVRLYPLGAQHLLSIATLRVQPNLFPTASILLLTLMSFIRLNGNCRRGAINQSLEFGAAVFAVGGVIFVAFGTAGWTGARGKGALHRP
ncbi:MAG: hypothetical protein K940chlam7_00954 [Chlamydiae bacterium]|nr:hypothetical protein [Chlamydiota bacterium]